LPSGAYFTPFFSVKNNFELWIEIDLDGIKLSLATNLGNFLDEVFCHFANKPTDITISAPMPQRNQ
jgi:hypothetical protein